MNAEELAWKIFTNGAVGLLDNIKEFEQAAVQRTREAIRDALLKADICQDCRSVAAEIAMTTPIE